MFCAQHSPVIGVLTVVKYVVLVTLNVSWSYSVFINYSLTKCFFNALYLAVLLFSLSVCLHLITVLFVYSEFCFFLF
jgi:hypothetical protein